MSKSKVALVTGSAKRIGNAISRYLASKGWDLALHYNTSREKVQVLEKELKMSFPDNSFRLLRADFSKVSEVENLISSVMDMFGGLNLLVNNASIFEEGCIKDTSMDMLERHIGINFCSPFILSRDYVKYSNEGVIVNFLDTRVTSNECNYAIYTLSKKLLWELTKMSALEFAPSFRVNAIAPGLILPQEHKPEGFEKKIEGVPLKRAAGLLPVVKSLEYILDNDDLTGQILFCDSGKQLLT